MLLVKQEKERKGKERGKKDMTYRTRSHEAKVLRKVEQTNSHDSHKCLFVKTRRRLIDRVANAFRMLGALFSCRRLPYPFW